MLHPRDPQAALAEAIAEHSARLASAMIRYRDAVLAGACYLVKPRRRRAHHKIHEPTVKLTDPRWWATAAPERLAQGAAN